MTEFVPLTIEFIIDSLPCKLIGMNSKLMCQYLEFVTDRLLVQLGYNKIYKVFFEILVPQKVIYSLLGFTFATASATGAGGFDTEFLARKI
jgi:ribonucleotide reductase beta subunit family protein with ferritin-like domain